MGKDFLGSLELQVLGVLQRPPADPYGLEIRARLKSTGKEISIGALYTCLERLERKGFVSSSWGDATAVRGGRKKRLFKIEALGRQALAEHGERTALFVGNPIPQV